MLASSKQKSGVRPRDVFLIAVFSAIAIASITLLSVQSQSAEPDASNSSGRKTYEVTTQWRISRHSLADYIADGYSLVSVIGSDFDSTGPCDVEYYLQKPGSLVMCQESRCGEIRTLICHTVTQPRRENTTYPRDKYDDRLLPPE